MTKNKLVMPFLKWVGGKRQLLDSFQTLLPKHITKYCEPFVGGGAMLFHLQPQNAVINDINQDLMGVYLCIQNHVDELIDALSRFTNDAALFYEIRDWDRDRKKYNGLSKIDRAARVIFLNKTCYNGLYRVNNAGEFNAPFGHYRNPNIVNAPVLRAVNSYLKTANISFYSEDYQEVLGRISKDTFVYLDPPYDPVSDTASFTGYSKGGFTKDDQIRLRECCDALSSMGIKFMLSNSLTDFIKEQYAAYHITLVQAKRAINSDASKRGDINEVVIRNYE